MLDLLCVALLILLIEPLVNHHVFVSTISLSFTHILVFRQGIFAFVNCFVECLDLCLDLRFFLDR